MNSKKVIRLKTPTRARPTSKSPESTFATHLPLPSDESLTRLQGLECSQQSLQASLAHEVNRAYQEIERMSRKVGYERGRAEELLRENVQLRGRVEVVEKEFEMYRFLYENERDNHLRLRQFYEEREKEWRTIISQQRQCIEEYTRKREEYQADIYFSQRSLERAHKPARSQEKFMEVPPTPQLHKKPVTSRPPVKKVKRLSTEGRIQPRPKEQPSMSLTKEGHYMREMQRIAAEQEMWARRSELLYQSILKGPQPLPKHPGQDELMDRIMRKTYCRLRDKKVSLGQLEQSEDMKKLRQAKSTTKERMAKTVRKLGFAVEEKEMAEFLDGLEREVVERFGELKGEWVVELIMGRLAECKKMAEGSHSEIERFEQDCQTEQSSLRADLPLESAVRGKEESPPREIPDPDLSTIGPVEDLSALINNNDTCPIVVDQDRL